MVRTGIGAVRSLCGRGQQVALREHLGIPGSFSSVDIFDVAGAVRSDGYRRGEERGACQRKHPVPTKFSP